MLQGRDVSVAKAMAFSSSGALAVLGDDFTIRIWDVRKHFLLRSIHVENLPFVPQLSWSDDEHIQVVGIASKDVYDLDGTLQGSERAMAFPVKKPDSPFDVGIVTAATSSAAAAIVRMPLNNGDRFGPYGPPSLVVWKDRDRDKGTVVPISGATSAAISPDGKTLSVGVATGKTEAEFKTELWIVPADGKPKKLGNADGWVIVLAVSPDGQRIVTTVNRHGIKTLSLVDVGSGKTIWTRESEPAGKAKQAPAFVDAAFSPVEGLIAVGLGGGRTQTFDAVSGRYQGTLGVPPRKFSAPAFVGDGKIAVIAGDPDAGNGGVTLWDLKEGTPVGTRSSQGAAFVAPLPSGALAILPRFLKSRCNQTGGYTLHIDVWEHALATSSAAGFETADRCIDGVDAIDDVDAQHQRVLVSRNMPRAGQTKWSPDLAVVDLGSGNVVALDESSMTLGGIPAYGEGLTADGHWVMEQISNDKMAWRLWDAKTGKVIIRAFGLAKGTDKELHVDMAATFDNTLAFAVQKTLVVREIKSDRELYRIDMPAGVAVVRFGTSASELFVADGKGVMHLVRDGKIVANGSSDGGAIEAIAVAPDGKTFATTSQDGALRIWDAPTATVRVALAQFEDDEWIASTPEGAYAGTTEVADRIGWVFDKPLEGFTFEQFSATFRDASLVKRRLAGERVDVSAHVVRPPHVTITSSPATAGTSATLKLHVSSIDRVDVVRLFVEGAPVAEKPVCATEGDVTLDAPLLAGTNRVTAVAYDARGAASNPAFADVTSTTTTKPELWIVAVGVGRYPKLGADAQLAASQNDARAIAAAFAAKKGSMFANVHSTVLTDAQATPTAIKSGLAGLAKMKSSDLAVVFFAGHGITQASGGDMVFVTDEASFAPDHRSVGPESATIGWRDIATALAAAKGRVLVLLDACHSGHVTQDLIVPNDALAGALVREGRAGAIVFAAAKGRQESYEPGASRGFVLNDSDKANVKFDSTTPHGFFTGALLGALADANADRNGDGSLQLSELVDEVSLRVASATYGMQTPWVARRDLIGDFAVVTITKN